MRFTKPAWVVHKDSAAKNEQIAKPLPIFSIHVHPDGSRIATGGLDAKIRIWSTKPILSVASDASGKPPKSLCTLTMHTGPVLTVRWAHSGRWLASGSDDEIVMIWDLDPTAKGKVWGSDEINVEGWKPLKRLPGHESDVTDLAWSPGDRYLASVGLDSMVIIWCGFTLERLRKLDLHQGFVKGVCWDPVGEFLATQSDDRSVKIWRTTDWSLESEVTKPFEDSPGSTFFRRLSWSPDGAHITASNATNNKGFVFIAAVIARNSWTSEISLVGHENTIEVAAYNPHIFLRNPASPVATSNICSVVALGADDRSVSIWQTKTARPLIVAKEVFERQIMDLSWSWDGMALYAASSDGTVAVFDFDPEELEGIAPHSVQEQYLKKFGFVPPPIPDGYSHNISSHTPNFATSSRITPPPSPPSSSRRDQELSQAQNGFGHLVNGSGERVNVLVAKRKGPKRVPLLSNTVPSASMKPEQVATTLAPTSTSTLRPYTAEAKSGSPSVNFLSPSQAPDAVFRSSSAELPSFDSNPFAEAMRVDADPSMDVPISSLDQNGSSTSNLRGKRKASVMDLIDDTRTNKPRTLGGDITRGPTIVRELDTGRIATPSTSRLWAAPDVHILQRPPVLTFLSARTEGLDDILEVRNPEDGSPSEVLLTNGKTIHFLDYLPLPLLSAVLTSYFCAVAMIDGSVTIYSHTGRRLMPALSLGSACSIMDGCQNCLMVVTCSGQLHSWNVKTQCAVLAPVSVLPLLSPSPNCTILSATTRPNGVPVIQCSSGIVHSYDLALLTWVKLGDRWWSEGSDAWQGRQRGSALSAGRGAVASMEGVISTNEDNGAAATEKPRPSWWNTALTLGHLESRMHAAKALDSPSEYKQALLLYAKKISDEAFKAKAEELIKELHGPVYWRPGREDNWSPTVLGMLKRDLLKEVLSLFVRSKNLAKMGMEWQELVKKASNDDL